MAGHPRIPRMATEQDQGTVRSWLRCYRCWSTNLEVQVHYEGVHRIDPATGERAEVVDELQEAVVQGCLLDGPEVRRVGGQRVQRRDVGGGRDGRQALGRLPGLVRQHDDRLGAVR